MRAKDLEEAAGVGRITKQNQTVDVGPNELKKQAAKFGNTVDKDGRPPTLSKKVKGSKTNVLFNLGMAENEQPKYTAMEWALMEGGHSVDDLDKPTPSVTELAKMHDVSTSHILKQLEMGIEAEYEHTSDLKIAKEIALDHIAEDPNYYDHLKFIERALKSKSYRKGYKAAKLSGRRKTRKLHTKFSDDINEAYKLQLERDYDMYVLHIKDTKTGKRTEVRGKKGYESGNYDPNDSLHILLDKVGKSANISELMNGEVVTINPKHPDADKAKAATDKAYSENYDHLKGHGTDVPLGKYLYHVTYAEALEGMLEDGHMNVKGPAPFHYSDYFSMTADPKYSVAGKPEVQIIIDTARVSKMETFEKYVDDWESTPGAGDWAKGDKGDFESEYRVEETIPLDYIVAVKILKSKATPEIIELAKKRGVKLVGKDTNVLENFADGKKKGKSRPGRVKRSGASCNGSVTDLRKRAKNSSGEKAKMYHWCANMKSGRKKK